MSQRTSELEEAVCRAIALRHDAMVNDLAEYVAIPTGKGHTPGLDALRERVVERLTSLGASVSLEPGEPKPAWLEGPGGVQRNAAAGRADPPPVVVARRSGGSGPRVLIAGHLDTVFEPDGAFQTMTAQDDGEHASGPGVVDMKGGVVLALHALECLAEAGVDLNWTVLLNSDEETGSFTSEAVLRRVAAEHDFGIAVEPALPDGGLAIERMGSGQFCVDVFGRSAHAGREFEKGVSAVTKLGEMLVELSQLVDLERGKIVNVGPLLGGPVTNAVPDYAACWGNVRYRDPAAGDELAEQIDALATADDAMPRVVVHRRWNRPAKPETDAVRRFAELTRDAAESLGQTMPFARTGGVCDGNILQDAGLATLDTLGVRGGNLHRTDEFIELSSLVERAQLLAVVLSRLASQR